MMIINPFMFATPAASTLTADPGAFAVTGNPVAFKRALRMSASPGAFGLTGNAASFQAGIRMPAALGSFALTGNDVSLKRSVRMSAATGTFTLTGNTAMLTFSAGSPDVWTYLGKTTLAQATTNSPSVGSVPMGTASVNREILIAIDWFASATGTHSIASATLGGYTGTKVGQAGSSVQDRNSEQWSFSIPNTEAATTGTLAMTKGGGISTPTWAMNIAVFGHVNTGLTPSLLSSHASFASGSAASVTLSGAGEYVVSYGHDYGNTSVAFDVTPDYDNQTSYILQGGSVDKWSRFGHGTASGSLTITMTSNPGTEQSMFATRWGLA